MIEFILSAHKISNCSGELLNKTYQFPSRSIILSAHKTTIDFFKIGKVTPQWHAELPLFLLVSLTVCIRGPLTVVWQHLALTHCGDPPLLEDNIRLLRAMSTSLFHI
jgi:hypothetical protein